MTNIWTEALSEWDLYIYSEQERAEEYCRGYLLRKNRQDEYVRKYGFDNFHLFVGSAARAYRYASPELRRYWDERPRKSFAEFAVEMGVREPKVRRQARTAAHARYDAMRKAG